MLNRTLLGMIALVVTASACSAEVKKLKGEDDDEDGSTYYHYDDYNRGYGDAMASQSTEDKGDDGWRQSCDSSECRELTVFVHYMLTKDLGDGVTVRIEAFDNANFNGTPKGTGEVTGFEAQTGEWKDTTMFLLPGEYYLRAYMRSDGDKQNTPYPLGDMQLVAGTPVGVYGALSSPSMVRIAPWSESDTVDPVHLNLDQLFEKPGSEPPTDARVRVTLTTPDGADIPDRKKVLIQLFETTDLERDALYTFELASEQFLVAGRPGRAEFLTPSLAEGDYILFVYLDADGNGFYDEGELAAVHKEDGLAKKLPVRRDTTRSIALPLTLAPELPAE